MHTIEKPYSLRAFTAARNHFLFCVTVIAVYFLPYFILGENAHLLIHDNLDSNLVWVKMLLENHAVFSNGNEVIAQAMNGLPRASYPVFDFSLTIFHLAGFYYGYVINKVLMSLLAFSGMFWLLHTYLTQTREKPFVLYGTSLLYALLPFWSFSMSVSGLPLAIYALLGMRSGRYQWMHLAVLFFYAFASSLVLTGFFLLIIASLLFLSDLIQKKKWNLSFFTGIAVLSAAYLLSHLPILQRIAGSPALSHRSSFAETGEPIMGALKHGAGIFLFGQYHAASLHLLILLPCLIWIFIGIRNKSIPALAWILSLFLLSTSLLYGLLQWEVLSDAKANLMKILPIQLQRFHFLHPATWYVLLAMAGCALWNSRTAIYIRIFLLIQLGVILSRHELITNWHSPSFRQFYAERSFSEIKDHIGQPAETYRVISLGMHPAVAQYNGLYTLDGYFADYPLSWKEKFRTIIAGELQSDEQLRKYFDGWGSRCYALSKQTGYLWPDGKYTGQEIGKIHFDFAAAYALGGRYLISPSPVIESMNPGLRLEGIFGPDKIYLYAIDPRSDESGLASIRPH